MCFVFLDNGVLVEVHCYANIVKVFALKLILIDIFENNKWSISSIISKSGRWQAPAAVLPEGPKT